MTEMLQTRLSEQKLCSLDGQQNFMWRAAYAMLV